MKELLRMIPHADRIRSYHFILVTIRLKFGEYFPFPPSLQNKIGGILLSIKQQQLFDVTGSLKE